MRGVGNFPERIGNLDGTAQGGSGFGLIPDPSFPNFNTLYLQSAPHKNLKFQKIPHAVNIRPPDCSEIAIEPQTGRKYHICPNYVSKCRFEPLRETSAAFHVYNVIDEHSKGWIFDCGADSRKK